MPTQSIQVQLQLFWMGKLTKSNICANKKASSIFKVQDLNTLSMNFHFQNLVTTLSLGEGSLNHNNFTIRKKWTNPNFTGFPWIKKNHCQDTRYELQIQQQRLHMNVSPGRKLVSWVWWVEQLRWVDILCEDFSEAIITNRIYFLFLLGDVLWTSWNSINNKHTQTHSLRFLSFFFFFCVDWSRLTEWLLALAIPVRKLLPWMRLRSFGLHNKVKLCCGKEDKTHLSWPLGYSLQISLTNEKNAAFFFVPKHIC